ncbi:hypothetical protein [Microbispora sp. H10949]|uniref:hypothetical protein n=1 Tax=Microbispora sp. H10949 TaxID=2729111 RepID=UPI0016028760|nr:hypothetical protein [Microbispora sp. H10949]
MSDIPPAERRHLIPAHGYTAGFNPDRGGSGTKIYYEPVIAFDDEGEPLIASERKLIRARDKAGFDGLSRHSEEFIAFVPGDGWMITNHDDADWVQRVVAWGIDRHGSGRPLTVTSDGELGVANREIAAWHPDLTPPAFPGMQLSGGDPMTMRPKTGSDGAQTQ